MKALWLPAVCLALYFCIACSVDINPRFDKEIREFFEDEDRQSRRVELEQNHFHSSNETTVNPANITTTPGTTTATTPGTTTTTTPGPTTTLPNCKVNQTDFNRQYCYALQQKGYCYLDTVKELCPQECGVCGTTYVPSTPSTTPGPTTNATTDPNCYEDNCKLYPGLYNCFTCPDQCPHVNCTTQSTEMTDQTCGIIAAAGYCSSAYIYCPQACETPCSKKTCPTP